MSNKSNAGPSPNFEDDGRQSHRHGPCARPAIPGYNYDERKTTKVLIQKELTRAEAREQLVTVVGHEPLRWSYDAASGYVTFRHEDWDHP